MRKSLIVLFSMTVLPVIGAIIYVAPAHVQIRGIAPPLPELDVLLALTEVEDKPTRVSVILTSTQSAPGREIGHHTVVVEWRKGRLFLIDAGMDEANALAFGELLETMWSAEPAVFHNTAFDALGEHSNDVRGVGFTHLHIDHTQGISAACANLPPFKVVLSAYQASEHNMNTAESRDMLSACPLAPTIDTNRLSAVPGFPGLGMYALGGHTPGSTLFAVALGDRVLLFTGDITNSKRDLLNDNGKGFLYSYLIVPEDTRRTRKLRAWFRELEGHALIDTFVSHDVADMQRLEAFQ